MQFAIYGLIMGCILLLATVGFSMIRRIEGFLNIAHGQMLAIGGYSCYVFNTLLGWHIIPSAIAAVLVTSIIGYLVAHIVFFPLKGKPALLIAIASTGASYVIQGLIEVIFGPNVKQYAFPPMRAVKIGSLSLAGPDQIAMEIGRAHV
jgi:branched-subunit amino acid ABC-type transport system permease component